MLGSQRRWIELLEDKIAFRQLWVTPQRSTGAHFYLIERAIKNVLHDGEEGIA